ncbi:MbtH family protein [Kalamiella sp. sgz302252]|uniref:MbtH family protein n=1 Tax=Pantoea sp. sgz302252 TaxID=3341827 RepID=UPI0036D42E32
MIEQQNPFDDETLAFRVLINEREQYSLWPAFAPVPAGWQSVAGPMPRAQAIDYIETHWLAMQPAAV